MPPLYKTVLNTKIPGNGKMECWGYYELLLQGIIKGEDK
jgi:hypothetical protein